MKKIFVFFLIVYFLFPFPVQSQGQKNHKFPKAYRNIYFGDSEEVVNRKIEEDEEITNDKIIYFEDEYLSFKLLFHYWKDQLYEIVFAEGPWVLYNSPNDPKLINVKEWLVSLIKQRYGSPTYVKGVTWDKRYYWTSKDINEEKKIEIFTAIWEGKGSLPYMRIYYPPFAEAKAKTVEEKARQEKEKIRKKKENAAQNF